MRLQNHQGVSAPYLQREMAADAVQALSSLSNRKCLLPHGSQLNLNGSGLISVAAGTGVGCSV